jgi:hypothetical protein
LTPPNNQLVCIQKSQVKTSNSKQLCYIACGKNGVAETYKFNPAAFELFPDDHLALSVDGGGGPQFAWLRFYTFAYTFTPKEKM